MQPDGAIYVVSFEIGFKAIVVWMFFTQGNSKFIAFHLNSFITYYRDFKYNQL